MRIPFDILAYTERTNPDFFRGIEAGYVLKQLVDDLEHFSLVGRRENEQVYRDLADYYGYTLEVALTCEGSDSPHRDYVFTHKATVKVTPPEKKPKLGLVINNPTPPLGLVVTGDAE